MLCDIAAEYPFQTKQYIMAMIDSIVICKIKVRDNR